MAKLNEGEKLNFPIEFYPIRRFLFFVLVMCILGMIFMIYDIVFPTPSHRGELPSFIKILIATFCMGFSWLLLKVIYQNKPNFSIYQDKIIINTPLSEPKTLYWQDIKAIHAHHGRMPTINFERVNAKLFERQESITLQYLKLNDMPLNIREVENILRQVFDNAKNNSNQPIIYQKVKLKFSDWY